MVSVEPVSKRKFTAAGVAALKAPGTYSDQQTPGLTLKILKSGYRGWYFIYRRGRISRALVLGPASAVTLKEARKRATDARRELHAGLDPFVERKRIKLAHTFGELAEAFVERWAKPRKRTWKRDRAMLATLVLPKWRNLPAREIKRADVRELLRAVPGATYPNRVRSLLSKVFAWALSEDLVEVNPVSGTSPAPERSRERVLTDDEIRCVWSSGDPVARLRLATAQRGSEVQHLTWSEISGDVWTIPAERSKNKREHRVPLSALALEILASVDRLEGYPRLFPYRPKPLGVAGARGHDLRRTAASRMAELGVARVVLARILNHTDASVTGIYDRHSYFPEMRAALERWAVEITHLISRI